MTIGEKLILDEVGVPLRARPGLVCVVESIPVCAFCDRAGIFDFNAVYAGRTGWMNGCRMHYFLHRSSRMLGVGRAQLLITSDQVGMTQLPRG